MSFVDSAPTLSGASLHYNNTSFAPDDLPPVDEDRPASFPTHVAQSFADEHDVVPGESDDRALSLSDMGDNVGSKSTVDGMTSYDNRETDTAGKSIGDMARKHVSDVGAFDSNVDSQAPDRSKAVHENQSNANSDGASGTYKEVNPTTYDVEEDDEDDDDDDDDDDE